MNWLRHGRGLLLALCVLSAGCATRHAVRCDTHLVPINPPPPKAAAASASTAPAATSSKLPEAKP